MPTPDHTAPASDQPALLTIDGPIATITLNRPAAFNSVDLSIAKKLEALSAEVEANDAIRVLVIQGEGRAFSAGGDLQTIGAAAASDTIAPVVGELLKHYHAFIETVRRMPKIVLSSVHGSAAGAGMGLAFVTDLCIAAEDARFTPAYARIGVSPDGGSTVGMVGTAELKAATQKFAERLAQNPPAAISGTKSLVYQAAVTPTRQQLDAEEQKIIEAMQTDAFRAAVKKFTSKGK
jgi:enoyl-CoA hydratase/carnithine racemase